MNIFNTISLKTLKKNKTRTIVTIIGVILSVSMITAVTTLVSTLQYNLIEQSKRIRGDWHLSINGLNNERIQELKNDKGIELLETVKGKGYAKFDNKRDKNKPYIFLAGISNDISDRMPFKLISGRLPKTENEIVMPTNLICKIEKFKVGKSITLNIGKRFMAGKELWQEYNYIEGEEELLDCKEYTFKIVGICETSVLNNYDAAGYPIYTVLDNAEDGFTTTYLKLKEPSIVFDFGENYRNKYTVNYNKELLRLLGISDNDRFNIVLYSLGGILVCIIMVGSVLLIYNAFSISVSERTRQFGLLSSIGATKKQLSRTVIFEACFVSSIGIPLGLIAGITGIAIALYLVGDAFAVLEIEGRMIIHFSPISIFVSILVSFVTVLISAYIPSKRATKYSAIEAIRQVEDVKINPKKVKTSKLIYKLFGLQGSLAQKNFKRNKRQYRSTVISLFVSIVLFISASAFTMYLSKGVGEVISNSNFDIIYNSDYSTDYVINEQRREEVYPLLANVEGVTDTCVYSYDYLTVTGLSKDVLSDNYKAFNPIDSDNEGEINVNLIMIDDANYKRYIDELGLTNYNITKGIAINKFKSIDDGKYYTDKIINKEEPLKMKVINDDQKVFNINIGYYTDKIPMGLSEFYGNYLTLVFPKSAKDLVFGDIDIFRYSNMVLNAENPKEVMPKLEKIIAENGLDYDYLYNIAESEIDHRNLVLVVNVFSYGFIVLISLIAVANVFNTVTTNYNLRKREFAMLKSVGMSKKEFYKMIKFECIIYGSKAIIWGLPISILIIYAIYRSVDEGYDVTFAIPWGSVIISILSVFIVVFASMIYAINKAKNENIIDALKSENL